MKIDDGFLYGMPIVIENSITKTIRCRRHKKWRIDKKWLKRYGYKDVQDDSKLYIFNGSLYMSQKCFDKLSKVIKENRSENDSK